LASPITETSRIEALGLGKKKFVRLLLASPGSPITISRFLVVVQTYGKNISLMEISKLISQLVRTFDFELANLEADLEVENIWFVK